MTLSCYEMDYRKPREASDNLLGDREPQRVTSLQGMVDTTVWSQTQEARL